MVITNGRVHINLIRLSPARGQLNRENEYFPCHRTRLRIWSRETGSAVPSLISLLILHTQAESGVYSRHSSQFPRRRQFIYTAIRHWVSPEFIGPQLRTNDIHCRESTGTGPAVLEVAPVTGAAFAGHLNQLVLVPVCSGRAHF